MMGRMNSPHLVVALALPGVVAFDLAIVTQVFGHADEEEYACVVASQAGGSVPTSSGFALADTVPLSQVEHADTVIVPGYRPITEPPEAVISVLKAVASRGGRVASVCTGAFALAATGLLDGLSATTHWQDAEALQSRHPLVQVDPDVLYIDHGRIATSAGVAAGIDLCLHLVREDLGQALSGRIARRMVVAPHRDGGQAQFIQRPLAPSTEPGISAVQQWALHHLSEPLTVADLALNARMSPRHLSRQWQLHTATTPMAWLAAQRVDEAKRLLETTDLTLEAIAARTGLGTPTNLRRHLRGTVALTPSAYRQAFADRSLPASVRSRRRDT